MSSDPRPLIFHHLFIVSCLTWMDRLTHCRCGIYLNLIWWNILVFDSLSKSWKFVKNDHYGVQSWVYCWSGRPSFDITISSCDFITSFLTDNRSQLLDFVYLVMSCVLRCWFITKYFLAELPTCQANNATCVRLINHDWKDNQIKAFENDIPKKEGLEPKSTHKIPNIENSSIICIS